MNKIIHECEVCGNTELDLVLNLGAHPLCDDLKPINSQESTEFYPIEILFCGVCKTAHQKHQVPKEKLFPASYHYRAQFTQDVLNGMCDLVSSCKTLIGDLNNKKIVDVGCNDGSLLKFFKKEGAFTIGVEPTGAAKDAEKNIDAIYNKYFDCDVATKILKDYGFPDVITFTNVFAHIDDLNALISALKIIMAPHTVLIIENHYLGSVFEKNQFDTFYHEHPRTYSIGSFSYIADRLQMQINNIEFPNRYGGNIRVTLSNNQALSIFKTLPNLIQSENSFKELFLKMNAFIDDWKEKKKKEILDLVEQHGPLYAKAFPGRAAILIKLLNLDVSHIAGVFERDFSMKIGHYLPGTMIPIIKDETMNKINPPVVLNLAWHIKKEIHSFLRANGYQGQIIDII
ncbi:MAG: class I SAM-dependent methyltransferase [Candidatus Paracaedibacteraceae bacterium]|nr:class I SAM-dependent methyltransferase [Candidatus Paracaedibacteraceae bacterium]